MLRRGVGIGEICLGMTLAVHLRGSWEADSSQSTEAAAGRKWRKEPHRCHCLHLLMGGRLSARDFPCLWPLSLLLADASSTIFNEIPFAGPKV